MPSIPDNPEKTRTPIRARFSLRMLFGFSFALATAFVTVAFIQGLDHSRDVAPSPIFLLFAIAGLLVFAAVGNALGSKVGAIIATAIALCVWTALIVMAFLAHDPLVAQLPLHIFAMVLTVMVIAASLLMKGQSVGVEPSESIDRLMAVKKEIERNRPAASSDDPKI